MVCDKGLRVLFCLFVHLHVAIRLPQWPLSTDVKFCFWISQFSSADPWACPYAGVTCAVSYDLILVVELGSIKSSDCGLLFQNCFSCFRSFGL